MCDYRWIKWFDDDFNRNTFVCGILNLSISYCLKQHTNVSKCDEIIINAKNQSKTAFVHKQWPIDYNSSMRKPKPQIGAFVVYLGIFLSLFSKFIYKFAICVWHPNMTGWELLSWSLGFDTKFTVFFFQMARIHLCNLCKLLPIRRRRLSTKFTLNK